MTQKDCESLQNVILAILIQQLPTHVAGFGNTDTTKIDDWVMIINDGPTSRVFIIFVEREIFAQRELKVSKGSN